MGISNAGSRFNLSPVLGFLAAGVALGPHGLRLVTELDDIAQIADIGVLFLLFEMGLELSIDRLKKLRVYAFGLGTLQVSQRPEIYVPLGLTPRSELRQCRGGAEHS